MDKTIYKVLTLKELIDQEYIHKSKLPVKALISRTRALHNYAVTPDSVAGEEEPAFNDFINAHDYYMSFASLKFVAEQVPILNMNNGYEVRVYKEGSKVPSFKFINGFRLW